jgi:long-chain fatty acid transport protein
MNKIFIFCLIAGIAHLDLHAQTGHTLNGSGARSLGMAGVATGYSNSATSALLWSPASITYLPSTLELSSSLISLDAKNYSELDLSLIDPSLPSGTILKGDLNDQTPSTVLPTLSFIYNPKNDWSFGIIASGIGGFGVDYRQNANSPISLLFGNIVSSYRLFQLSVTTAYQVTDKLSVALTPTFNIASLELAPIVTARPFVSDTGILYPTGDEAMAIGYGLHAGLTYEINQKLSIGLLYKSKQNFENFEYDQQDGIGARSSSSLDYPMILSAGVSYKGLGKALVALDFRFVDFSSTNGLGDTGFGPDLAINGFGWDDAYFVGLGVEYPLSELITVRSGYSYNTSPIKENVSFFSTIAPAIIQHAVGTGATFNCSEKMELSLGYHHGFKETIEGPIILPSPNGGQSIPSINRSSLSTNVFSIDIGFKF